MKQKLIYLLKAIGVSFLASILITLPFIALMKILDNGSMHPHAPFPSWVLLLLLAVPAGSSAGFVTSIIQLVMQKQDVKIVAYVSAGVCGIGSAILAMY